MSRIEKAYEQSDQRVYHVPCPECSQKQQLLWKNVVWDEGKPETASLVCEHCGSVIDESKKQWMLMNGEWQKTKESNKAGFHISELYSPFRTIKEVVADFLEAKKTPQMLQTFTNTTLGETWEAEGEELLPDHLLERCENYNHEALPSDILFLTAGVDVQKDRLEAQVIGYADEYECWVVEYKIFWGNTSTMEVWTELDQFLMSTYSVEDGRRLNIACSCIDSGYNSDIVYQFTKPRQGRRVFAVK
jgi:phage terminase large subunit GpA-like protein